MAELGRPEGMASRAGGGLWHRSPSPRDSAVSSVMAPWRDPGADGSDPSTGDFSAPTSGEGWPFRAALSDVGSVALEPAEGLAGPASSGLDTAFGLGAPNIGGSGRVTAFFEPSGAGWGGSPGASRWRGGDACSDPFETGRAWRRRLVHALRRPLAPLRRTADPGRAQPAKQGLRQKRRFRQERWFGQE